jgi:DNA-binding TFAR19-related protein (PDSD5 family)
MSDFASAAPATVGSDGVVNAGDQDAERERQEANEARRASALASILEPAARERCTCARV